MNRRTLYTVAIAVLIVLVFFNPFKKRTETDIPLPYVQREVLDELTEYLTQNPIAPEQYLARLFDSNTLVFVGEFGRIRSHVEIIGRTIPELYKRGVYNLGIEYALFRDTPLIDRILTADEYDEQAVYEILFNRMVIWGYQEYADLFKAAWELNASLPEGAKPFRIVGLNVPVSWEHLINERDSQNPEIIAKVYEAGIPDIFMAETIIREFAQKGESALIYGNLQRAFTSFVVEEYAKNARKIGLPDDRRTGKIVFDRVGANAATVLFHAPWPYDRAQTLIAHPVDGVIDRLIERLDPQLHTVAFDTVGTPFGGLDADRNDFAKGHDRLKFSELCDGYIITGPIASYETVSPIPGFIDEANLEETLRRFPGPNVEGLTVEELNGYIATVLESTAQMLEKF